MAIIGLSGYAGSGKDTVAQMIQELQPDKNWQIKKFSGKLKQMASLLTGIDVKKFEDQNFKKDGTVIMMHNILLPESFKKYQIREFLQFLGTECVRDLLGEDIWINALLKDYDYEKDNWIVTDVRFLNEAEAIANYGKIGYCIRINRGNAINAHPSETALDKYVLDYRLDNMGDLEDLRNDVEYMLKHL